ncbi:hypothetical protein AAFC00_003889 [Neodothiora populina]|uniref:Rho-GAP domain-containing protein n=1 Tax=Neodothiora populina TaxID=2781224 RepID=A0ABR3PFY9_9PEZI
MAQQVPGLVAGSAPKDPHNHQHAPQTATTSNSLHSIDIDISSLDVRDIRVGTAGSSTQLPSSPNDGDRERDASKSFFGSRGTSPSGRPRDDSSATFPMAKSSDQGSARPTSMWPSFPANTRATNASSPTESDSPSQDGRRSGEAPLSKVSTSVSQNSLRSPSTATLNHPPQQPTPGPKSAPLVENKKPNKKRLQMLSRSKSVRAEDELSKSKKSSSKKVNGHQARARSEDRLTTMTDEDLLKKSKSKKEKEKDKKEIKDKQASVRQGHPLSSSLRQHNTSTFFNEFRNTSSNAAIGIGKAGKGLFSKFSRSGSTEKPVTPIIDHTPGVLTLPLIQQTRITRIAKSYDQCKDKTEFWMPALPWRCIDYLNGKCEEEGLYRVSGGLTKVKEWRKRFDTELDVNLLDESELYDASIIASLFKEWIRELPEDVFPKDAQERITSQLPRELPERGAVTQMLRDELQQLAPFNYYLLFAITCHLSLLLSYESKNKMTLDNLYRCFNQSLKLDGRIFYTLVGEWRQCWAGCLTENEYLKAEYDYLQHPYPQFIRDNEGFLLAQSNERAISSSGSSAPTAGAMFPQDLQRPATSHTEASHSAAEEGAFLLTPMRRSQRSSSDVTGMSPMKVTLDTTLSRETP